MHETRWIDSDRARLAVHLHGKGPLAVLIHGYPLDHSMWLDLCQSSLAERRQLAAIDLRGHGDSPWAGDAVHAMELLADDVAAVIRTLADDAVDVAALSMGGYVALALCERHAALVRSLVLVDTRAGADSPAGRQGRQAAMAGVLRHGRRWLAEQMLPKLVATGADALVQARVQSMIESTPVETVLADLRGMMQRPDRRELLSQLQLPVLVVVGEHDAITPVAEAKAIAAAVTGARLLVVPGAGHMVPMEAPSAFANELATFWTRR